MGRSGARVDPRKGTSDLGALGRDRPSLATSTPLRGQRTVRAGTRGHEAPTDSSGSPTLGGSRISSPNGFVVLLRPLPEARLVGAGPTRRGALPQRADQFPPGRSRCGASAEAPPGP